MDQQEALAKARRFADRAYADAVDQSSKKFQTDLSSVRATLSRRGLSVSGTMTYETARVHGQHVNDLLEARLNALLEGCDLHNVSIDDELAKQFVKELIALRSSLISNAQQAAQHATGLLGLPSFPHALEQNIKLSENSIRVAIERKQFMKKPTGTTVYHVEGDNARINVNSTDNSVNVITTSTEQVFADLRQKLTQQIPSGDEQKVILDKLTALEEAKVSQSFGQRYTEFIAVAANYMTIVGPFIPALTEMLKKALGG